MNSTIQFEHDLQISFAAPRSFVPHVRIIIWRAQKKMEISHRREAQGRARQFCSEEEQQRVVNLRVVCIKRHI